MSSQKPGHPAPSLRQSLFRPPEWSRVVVREKPEPEPIALGEDGLTIRLTENSRRIGVAPEVMEVLGIIVSKTEHGSDARLQALWLLNDLVEHEEPSRLAQALRVCISLMAHSSEPASFLHALVCAEQLHQRSVVEGGAR